MRCTHTQGRLHVRGTTLRDDGAGIDCIATMQVSNKAYWDQDARRLVACWNACEGISTDLLESMPAIVNQTVPYYQMKITRDEVMEALTFAIRFFDQLTPADAERMRTILAKANGVCS